MLRSGRSSTHQSRTAAFPGHLSSMIAESKAVPVATLRSVCMFAQQASKVESRSVFLEDSWQIDCQVMSRGPVWTHSDLAVLKIAIEMLMQNLCRQMQGETLQAAIRTGLLGCTVRVEFLTRLLTAHALRFRMRRLKLGFLAPAANMHSPDEVLAAGTVLTTRSATSCLSIWVVACISLPLQMC